MPRSPDIKGAGDDETAAGLLAARVSLQSVIGAGGAEQGLQDGDVPGPIPNAWFSNTANVQRLGLVVYVATGSCNGFCPSALEMPFAGQLYAVTVQADPTNAQDVIIGRESGAARDGNTQVVTRFNAPAVTARPYKYLIAELPQFKVGDVLVITTKASGVLPDVGSKITTEELLSPGSYEFWFFATEEPSP